jgi:hypothetical protein
MAEHTPGPWVQTHHEHGSGLTVQRYRTDICGRLNFMDGKRIGSEPVCSLYSGFVGFEPNANLICAAPDLLAACKEALEVLGLPYQATQRKRIEEAIAKAEGMTE